MSSSTAASQALNALNHSSSTALQLNSSLIFSSNSANNNPTTTKTTTTTTTFSPVSVVSTETLFPTNPSDEEDSASHVLTYIFVPIGSIILVILLAGLIIFLVRKKRLDKLRHHLMPLYNFDPTEEGEDWESELLEDGMDHRMTARMKMRVEGYLEGVIGLPTCGHPYEQIQQFCIQVQGTNENKTCCNQNWL